MNLTQKEQNFLTDFKNQELLCIEKYEKYASQACSGELKSLFTALAESERGHLRTVDEMATGHTPTAPSTLQGNNALCASSDYRDEASRKADEFLCRDMLASEKHASALYDTGIFEFCDPSARKMLAHMQAEEQQHGEELAAYMKNNGMTF